MLFINAKSQNLDLNHDNIVNNADSSKGLNIAKDGGEAESQKSEELVPDFKCFSDCSKY